MLGLRNMSKNFQTLIADLPGNISKHQNLIIAFALVIGVSLGSGLFVGELWGEGKMDKPLVPSSQKYSQSNAGSTLGVSTSSADTQTDSSSTTSTDNFSKPTSVAVSSQKVSAPSTSTRSTSSTTTSTKAVKAPPPPPPSASNPLNINTASEKELEELPGIGTTYATRIVNDRPYASIEDLITKIDPGTGKPILYLSTYNKIKDMIFFQ